LHALIRVKLSDSNTTWCHCRLAAIDTASLRAKASALRRHPQIRQFHQVIYSCAIHQNNKSTKKSLFLCNVFKMWKLVENN
jgi:hypothetical protein